MSISRKALVSAGKELKELLFAPEDTQIDVKAKSDILQGQIIEACGLLEETDIVSQGTIDTLCELGCTDKLINAGILKGSPVEQAEEASNDTEEDEDEEQTNDDDETEENEDGMTGDEDDGSTNDLLDDETEDVENASANDEEVPSTEEKKVKKQKAQKKGGAKKEPKKIKKLRNEFEKKTVRKRVPDASLAVAKILYENPGIKLADLIEEIEKRNLHISDSYARIMHYYMGMMLRYLRETEILPGI